MAERAGMVFEQGQKQTRADAEIAGNIVNDLRPTARFPGGKAYIILEPARPFTDERLSIKTNGSRAIDELAIGNNLV